MVYTNTRTLNQLISSLKSYYPVSLELFSHNSEIFLHFIMEYPTPKKAAKVTITKFKNFLKKHAYSAPHKIDMLFEKLKEPMIPVEDWIVESKAVYTSSLVEQLKMLRKQIKVYDDKISDLVNAHSSHEIFDSLPGCGSVLQSELMINFGDNKEIFSSYKNVQQQAGTAPITKQSGTYKVVKFRRACSHPFRDTMHSFAFSSITKSLWAKRYY
ncbi:MAG: IS110 family transposase, partial [PVC group bacterium]|nr:IS110 family transposase [PVC group bacterium]